MQSNGKEAADLAQRLRQQAEQTNVSPDLRKRMLAQAEKLERVSAHRQQATSH